MYCLINGHRAIPTGSVKVTLENQRVKSSGEYTYDISFPLDMPENIEAFGLMGRVDVSKAVLEDFDDCKFFGANQLLVVGTGTVTGITDTTLKLQIVGGKSSLSYRLQKEEPWIDQLTYPDVVSASDKAILDGKRYETVQAALSIAPWMGTPSLNYCGFTVCNKTTGACYNAFTPSPTSIVWHSYVARPMYMAKLMYVLSRVFNSFGYDVIENVFNVAPWNSLYIVHINRSKTIAGMLPHWKVKTFLDEFRQLFNATFLIDEQAKTVRIVRATGITDSTVVKVDVADDFSMEYEEDGLSLEPTNNLRYKLQSCDEPAVVEEIDPEILSQLNLATYATVAAMNSAVSTMTGQQVLTTLFKVTASGYFYWRKNGENLESVQCAYMQQLTRTGNDATGKTTTLRMVPASMGLVSYYGRTMVCPCVEGPDEDLELDDESTENIVTVEEILTEGADPPGQEEEAEVMPLAFLMEQFQNYNIVGSTDFRISGTVQKAWSLALECFGQTVTYLGKLHEQVPRIDRTHLMVYNLLLTGDIPSPSSVFLIRGHRYLCSKLELTASEKGIDKVVRGEFHEILA